MKQHHGAFTLIELLVVMAIIALLSSLIYGLLIAGSTTQDQQNTKSLLRTVGTAVDQFRNETGAVPLPTGSAADPNSGTWYPSTNTGSWDKQRLWWRLSHAMTLIEKDTMRSQGEAVSLAEDPFQSMEYMRKLFSSNATRRTEIQSRLNKVTDAEADAYKGFYVGSEWLHAAPTPDVNSQANLLSHRGSFKRFILNIRASVAADLERRKYMTYPCIELDDLVDKNSVEDNCIIDSWGNPLIYAAHSTIAIQERGAFRTGQKKIEHRASGRSPMTDRNNDGVINKADWSIKPPKAQDLVDHNGDSTIDADDWASILWNARPGFELSFFLASAGPDFMFNCLYADDINDDNLIFSMDQE